MFDASMTRCGIPRCRTCQSASVRCLGKLKDSNWFAGRQINDVLLGGSLWRCSNCEFVFRSPLLPDSEYARLYETGGLDVWDSDLDREDFRLIRRILYHLSNRELKVLDFGCYTGQLLKSLSKKFILHGVEPNLRAAEIAQAKGIALVNDSFTESHVHTELYDIILACDVLEHIANPIAQIADFRARLQKGGLLLVSTGNCDSWLWRLTRARFWYCQMPEHISFIGPKWIRRMPASLNLRLEDCVRFNHRGGHLRLLSILAALSFALSPRLYGAVKRLKSVKRPSDGVPGHGATKDHILCVFRAV